MKNSKLVQTISLLSAEELSWFKKFLLSKMFNHNEELLLLFNYIRKQLKANKPDFSKQQVHQALFSHQPFDKTLMLRKMSHLFKCLEQFLALNEFYAEQHTASIALCRSYRKRNMPKLVKSTIQKTKKQLQSAQKRNIDHHISVFQLEMEAYTIQGLEKRSDTTNLQEINDQLDITYFAQKLRQCCLMKAHQNVFKVEFELGIAQKVINEVEQKQLYTIPAIGIYYYTYKAQLESENIKVFKDLQNQLVSYAGLFDPIELGQSYLLAINLGIKLLNKGETQLMNEILALYKTGIESKVLIFNNRLSRFTYKNTITLAIRLREYEWVSYFLNKFKEFLDPNYQEESFSYGLAHLYYAQKNYEDALKLLFMNVKSDDVFMNLSAKVLLTRIFYEQSEMDSLEAEINSFKTFIRRKNMISYQKPHYQNFINTMNKLIRLNPFDKSAKATLRQEIEALQPLPVKYWFLEQV